MSFCSCGNHHVKQTKLCENTNCSHQHCVQYTSGGICSCHFKKVSNRKDLCNIIQGKDSEKWFYIGSSGMEGKKFFNYVSQPVECTRYVNQNQRKLVVTAHPLDECYYWDKSTGMEGSEQFVLDFAYKVANKEKFDKFKGGLNDELDAKSRKKNKSGTVYVRFYLDKNVKYRLKK